MSASSVSTLTEAMTLPRKCTQKMLEERLPLQQACYGEHNSLVFLPRCTLSLLWMCTAYLLLQSLTILVGPEIKWNKSKMKYEWKPTRGGNGSGREDRSSDRSAGKDGDRLLATRQGRAVWEWCSETVGCQRLTSPTVSCFCCLINSLSPWLSVPSQIKDFTPSLCIRPTGGKGALLYLLHVWNPVRSSRLVAIF